MIYIFNRGEQSGPYMLAQVESMWLSGTILADALYWHEEQQTWQPIVDLFSNGDDSPSEVDEQGNEPFELFIEYAGLGRLITNFPRSALFTTAYEVLEDYGVKITDSVEDGILIGETGMNMSSFGQSISLELDFHPKGTLVQVDSKSDQLFDWGRGKKDKETIVRKLAEAIQSAVERYNADK